MIKTKDIISMPVEKIQNMFDKRNRINNAKVLSKNEELELKSQAVSFAAVLKKCGNGQLISPEMKPVIKQFERANYDFNKLPMSMKKSLESTYIDFKNNLNNTNEFNKTSVELYCKIYEFFHNAGNINFIQKIRKDPNFKKTGISTESLVTFNDVAAWIHDERGDRSVEFGTSFASTINTAMGPIKAAGSVSLTLPKIVLVILSVIIVTIIALITCLIIINLKYKSELTEILKKITNNEVSEKGPVKVKEESTYIAAKNMWEKTSPLMKNNFYKPMDFACSSLQNISNQGYEVIDKMNRDAKKFDSKENFVSKEDYERSQELFFESFMPVAFIVTVVLLFMMLKPIVYFIYNLKMKISQFFEEEATLLEINIEQLVQMQNEAPTEAEKLRIGRIIDKQRKTMTNMSALSNFFYKQTNDAAVKTRDDIRDTDSINYDRIIENNDPVKEDKSVDEPAPIDPYEEPKKDDSNGGNSGSNGPGSGTSVVLF